MDDMTVDAGVETAEVFSDSAPSHARQTAALTGHLYQLEAEAIYVLREVAAQFERPCLLFSGGKDSIVCAHLAHKAFAPGRIPFPLLHIDTGTISPKR